MGIRCEACAEELQGGLGGSQSQCIEGSIGQDTGRDLCEALPLAAPNSKGSSGQHFEDFSQAVHMVLRQGRMWQDKESGSGESGGLHEAQQ